MSQLTEFVKCHFMFLQRYGYTSIEENLKDSVSLIGRNNRIDIIFSAVGCELTCYFVDDRKIFSLQDALEYMGIKEKKGLYQISRREDLEIGIVYLADAVKILFERIDISITANFLEILQYRIDMHKKLLEEYYSKNDIIAAEVCWKNGEYSKAQELYEKHVCSLSKTQLKKLNYIKKCIEGFKQDPSHRK